MCIINWIVIYHVKYEVDKAHYIAVTMYFCHTFVLTVLRLFKCYNVNERVRYPMLFWLLVGKDFQRTPNKFNQHYDDVIMTMLASQITSLTVVYSIVYSGVNQRKYQSSASLAFVRKIHRGPVNFPHKCPVTRKMFPFDDVIMRVEWSGITIGNVITISAPLKVPPWPILPRSITEVKLSRHWILLAV